MWHVVAWMDPDVWSSKGKQSTKNHLHSNTESGSRRHESSFKLLWEPQILQCLFHYWFHEVGYFRLVFFKPPFTAQEAHPPDKFGFHCISLLHYTTTELLVEGILSLQLIRRTHTHPPLIYSSIDLITLQLQYSTVQWAPQWPLYLNHFQYFAQPFD